MQKCTPRSLSAVLLVTLCLLGGALVYLAVTAEAQTIARAAAEHSDYWEEDDAESLKPITHRTSEKYEGVTEPATHTTAAPGRANTTQAAPKSLLFQAVSNAQPVRESLLLACVTVYVIAIFRGRRRNRSIATTWAKAFCDLDGLFDQQFAQLGDPQLTIALQWILPSVEAFTASV